MKRSLALSLSVLLLPLTAAAADGQPSPTPRYRLTDVDAVPRTARDGRFGVITHVSTAVPPGRFLLLGAVGDLSTLGTCGSGDVYFADGFEN